MYHTTDLMHHYRCFCGDAWV